MKFGSTSSCLLKTLKEGKMSSKEKTAWVSISVSWLKSVQLAHHQLWSL